MGSAGRVASAGARGIHPSTQGRTHGDVAQNGVEKFIIGGQTLKDLAVGREIDQNSDDMLGNFLKGTVRILGCMHLPRELARRGLTGWSLTSSFKFFTGVRLSILKSAGSDVEYGTRFSVAMSRICWLGFAMKPTSSSNSVGIVAGESARRGPRGMVLVRGAVGDRVVVSRQVWCW